LPTKLSKILGLKNTWLLGGIQLNLATLYSLPAKKSSLEIPEASHISTSENIFSCKLIEHIFAYKTQQDFEAKKYVVARGDTK
jgi:hypothetical protein